MTDSSREHVVPDAVDHVGRGHLARVALETRETMKAARIDDRRKNISALLDRAEGADDEKVQNGTGID